jgi:hypothetical protein
MLILMRTMENCEVDYLIYKQIGQNEALITARVEAKHYSLSLYLSLLSLSLSHVHAHIYT